MKLVFDIETNGFLDVLDRIHSLVAYDIDSGKLYSFADQTGYEPISKGIALLKQADQLIGHNILGFDLPALKKLGLLDYEPMDCEKYVDTLVMSRLHYAHIESLDWNYKWAGMPIKLYGKHSLESWGYRVKYNKGDFGKQNGWDTWSKAMQDYCEDDVHLNVKVYSKVLTAMRQAPIASELEHKFSVVLEKQMTDGVPFNTANAKKLADEIRPQAKELKANLQAIVPPFISYSTFTPKRNNKTLGYQAGVPIAKKLETIFNPGSRPQIVRFLKKNYRWQPVDFTDKNNPKVDREVLGKLTNWREVPMILDYLDMSKLMGMLETGKNSWLNFVKNGRLHGRIIHNGAITGRCTHFNPNLGQVPAVRSFKGLECRELFYAPDGYRFVGCDASGLELRMLGHYLYRYDGGEYAREVVEGDIHTLNQQAAQLPTRDDAKTFIYAVSYGAGDAKLGSILEPQASESRQRSIGAQLRARFELRIPSYRTLVSDVKQKVKVSKGLRSLDGRYLYPRGQHMALNTLLQGAGAVVMKKACVLAYEMIQEAGLDAYQVLHVHDEMQYICIEKDAEQLGTILEDSIRLAGEYFKLNLALKGVSKIGNNWGETH